MFRNYQNANFQYPIQSSLKFFNLFAVSIWFRLKCKLKNTLSWKTQSFFKFMNILYSKQLFWRRPVLPVRNASKAIEFIRIYVYEFLLASIRSRWIHFCPILPPLSWKTKRKLHVLKLFVRFLHSLSQLSHHNSGTMIQYISAHSKLVLNTIRLNVLY